MFNKIKLWLLVYGAIYLLICFFVVIGLWAICSIWWVVTNNMIDRSLFLLLSLGISKLVSLCVVLIGLLPEKK